jgi:hypothetical protein
MNQADLFGGATDSPLWTTATTPAPKVAPPVVPVQKPRPICPPPPADGLLSSAYVEAVQLDRTTRPALPLKGASDAEVAAYLAYRLRESRAGGNAYVRCQYAAYLAAFATPSADEIEDGTWGAIGTDPQPPAWGDLAGWTAYALHIETLNSSANRCRWAFDRETSWGTTDERPICLDGEEWMLVEAFRRFQRRVTRMQRTLHRHPWYVRDLYSAPSRMLERHAEANRRKQQNGYGTPRKKPGESFDPIMFMPGELFRNAPGWWYRTVIMHGHTDAASVERSRALAVATYERDVSRGTMPALTALPNATPLGWDAWPTDQPKGKKAKLQPVDEEDTCPDCGALTPEDCQ